MADQLDMGRLSLKESQHAPSNNFSERSAYIPPHLRNRTRPQSGNLDGAPPAVINGGNGINGSAWASGDQHQPPPESQQM